MTQRRAAVPAALLLTLGLAACGAANEEPASGGNGGAGGDTAAGSDLSGTIAGAGASSQAAAMEAWIAGFTGANPDATVNYDPVGSGGGREQFTSGGTVFAGSDAYLEDEDLTNAQETCGGDFIELPLYISPIAVVFNLEGVEELNLGPKTIAGIFAQEITNWNDPAIAEENPDAELPDLPITPVNRSDESGTTENFVDYLSKAAPEVWTYEVSGDWPVPGGEAAGQSSGVAGAVGGGDGTIGYIDASQAGDLGIANVLVGEDFTEFSPEAAAAVVEASERLEDRGDYSYAYDLARDTTEAGTYPIVLVSYSLACTTYEDQETADLVKGFLTYVVSEEGQAEAAEAAGSAPISDGIRESAMEAIDAISAG